jgi:signal transduction histidine kinase
LVERKIKLKQIKLTQDIPADLPLVILDENQMTQVLVNVLLNAIQAMKEKGELTLRCYQKKLVEITPGVGRRKTDPLALGQEVLICEIKDTGAGIPLDEIDKVFDPFFTTKPPGEGTGLGLSVSRTIVETHGGLIGITSQIGRGTTVTLTLPIGRGV